MLKNTLTLQQRETGQTSLKIHTDTTAERDWTDHSLKIHTDTTTETGQCVWQYGEENSNNNKNTDVTT